MYKLGSVRAAVLNVRDTPSLNGNIVDRINIGTVIAITQENNGFVKIGDNHWVAKGWVQDYDATTVQGKNIDPIVALSFLEVESNNYAFHNGLLIIRFEVHRFQTFLNNDELFNRHFRFNGRNYNEQFYREMPSDNWINVHGSQVLLHSVLKFARSLNNNAALFATGMGLGQIMGHNHARIGYDSAQQMFNAFANQQYGLTNQVIGFINYVLSDPNMHNALLTENFHKAIQLYNGIGQEHIYLPKLESSIRKFEMLF